MSFFCRRKLEIYGIDPNLVRQGFLKARKIAGIEIIYDLY